MPFKKKTKLISTALSPNTERDDVLLARQLLRHPKRWTRGGGVKNLEEKFKEVLPIKYAYAVRSGRCALYAVLKALGIKSGDEVILQAYTCAAVPDAILWAGASPVYADIDENTFNMSPQSILKRLSPRAKAIIIQHTFGEPAELKKIMSIAKARGLLVIEDCAHALGGSYYGKPLGVFGDASIFSFGRDKVISGVTGGMIATNSLATAKNIENEIKKYKQPSPLWIARQILHPIIMNKIILPTYGWRGVGKILLEILKVIGLVPKVIYPEEKFGRRNDSFIGLMPNALAVLALHQLKKLHRLNSHRAEIAGIYEESLKSLSNQVVLPKNLKTLKSVFLRYAIRAPKAMEILRAGREQNIILGDWYGKAVAPEGVNYASVRYNPESCPQAEAAALESLNLPTSIRITEDDARRIAEFVKSFFQS